MDREAIQTSYEYSKLWEQHFSGGYFSDKVKQDFEAVESLSDQEKQQYYAEQFNEVFDSIAALQMRVGASSIDLSDQGLGVIDFETDTVTAEDTDDGTGYRGLQVQARSFTPQIEGRLVYTRPDDLQSNTQHLQTDAQHPAFWTRSEGNHYLGDDGSLEEYDIEHIDQVIIWMLDTKETLAVAEQALQEQENASIETAKTLGQAATSNS